MQPATLQAMAQVLLDQRAVVAWPELAGERGHPVAFGRDCLPDLLALQGEKGAAPPFASPCVVCPPYGMNRTRSSSVRKRTMFWASSSVIRTSTKKPPRYPNM